MRPQGVPDEVWAAVESVSTIERIHDVRYQGRFPCLPPWPISGIGVEFEAEACLGDAFSAGLGNDAESRIATGWIMMLYARRLRIDWDSNWRCVAFARLPLETAENDSLTPGMYWDDMRLFRRHRAGFGIRRSHRDPKHGFWLDVAPPAPGVRFASHGPRLGGTGAGRYYGRRRHKSARGPHSSDPPSRLRG